jgi:hypothetical protein
LAIRRLPAQTNVRMTESKRAWRPEAMALEIISFKPFVKNTLQGFATVRMSNIGLEIRDVCLHQKDGKRWLQLPSKAYKKNGKTAWSYILDFYDKTRGEQFQKSALEALDRFIAGGGADGF